MDKKQLSANNLKQVLWETLQGIQDKSVAPAEADSIATQAREILRTTNVQLQIAKQTKRDVTAEVILFSESK